MPKVCTGGRSRGPRLPTPCQIPALYKKEVWSTDHVVGTESRHSEPPWSSRGGFLPVLGNCLPVKLPDASQGPTSKAGLSEDKPSWTCCINTSCTERKSRFILYCREPGVALSRVTACHPPGQTHISNRRLSANVLGCLPPSVSHTKIIPHLHSVSGPLLVFPSTRVTRNFHLCSRLHNKEPRPPVWIAYASGNFSLSLLPFLCPAFVVLL